MKKFIQILMAFCLISIFIFVPFHFCYGAGTVTITKSDLFVQNVVARKVLTISWVADSADATVPNTTITSITYGIGGWYIYSAETNPGAVAPTDNYDITILDADGVDLAGGMLMNRDTANTEMVGIALGTIGHYPIVRGNLTFTLSNNLVNSATGTCILTFIAN